MHIVDTKWTEEIKSAMVRDVLITGILDIEESLKNNISEKTNQEVVTKLKKLIRKTNAYYAQR